MVMAGENAPLLTNGVFTIAGEREEIPRRTSEQSNTRSAQSSSRKLNTFFGVMVPTILSMFSIVLFLRTGFVVGHAGLLQGLLMLGVAYFIISLTVLSICAISTNGAVEGGGAYCILDAIGPKALIVLKWAHSMTFSIRRA